MLGGETSCKVPRDLIEVWSNSFNDDRKIAEGAFGVVYEGLMSVSHRQVRVAVKRLHSHVRPQGDETEQQAALSSAWREVHVFGSFSTQTSTVCWAIPQYQHQGRHVS